MKKFFLACFLIVSASFVGAAEKNLIELHKNIGKMGNKECLRCHLSITKETAINKKFKTFHRVHLESKLGTPKDCTDCHKSVDLRESSAAALRKQVDPEFCAGCHSGGIEGAKVLFTE